MPLKAGNDKETISENIAELVREYKSDGKIGNTEPKDMKHAQQIATAIAYKEAEKSEKKAKTEALKGFLKSLITDDNHELMESIAYGYAVIFEGYSIVPPIDRDRYTEIPGMEGPYRMPPAGRIVYYDPSEGRYYDRDKDMYIEGEEADEFSKPWPNAVNENENPESITIPLPTDPQGIEKVKQEIDSELTAYKDAAEVTKGAMAAQAQAEENLKSESDRLTEEYEREKETQSRDASGTM